MRYKQTNERPRSFVNPGQARSAGPGKSISVTQALTSSAVLAYQVHTQEEPQEAAAEKGSSEQGPKGLPLT